MKAHSNVNSELSAGMKALPDGGQSYAQTQALWRFLANDEVTFEKLSEPLLEMAHNAITSHCDKYVLTLHDWSRIHYGGHSSKKDRLQMTHETDIGYELQSTLLVSDRDGSPLVSPIQNLVTANSVLSTREMKTNERMTHLDELTERIQWSEQQGFSKKLVHIVDREADSVGHLRQWSQGNSKWLIRAKEGSTAEYQGKKYKLKEIGQQLQYQEVGVISAHGQKEIHTIAGADIVLTRNAKSKKIDPTTGKRVAPEEGIPLKVRLIVSRVYAQDGKLIAQWYLLSNVEQEVSNHTLSTWYYYRWRIESYFKVLKQAGHQIEHWEQESGRAIFKRLLIVSQACALAWRIMRLNNPEGEKIKIFLVRLSGRQMKRKQPVTLPALLDGLFKLFMMLEVMENYSIDELKTFAQIAMLRDS